jgi:hypothetical protein
VKNIAEDGDEREFLVGCLDAYLEALDSRDPSVLPLAPTVRFTENAQELLLGAGLWATASPGGAFTRVIHVVEPSVGQAFSFNIVTENGFSAHLALRLKVQDQLITEIETLVVRERLWDFDTDAILAERAGLETLESLDAPLVEAERSSRAELVAIAESYFDGIVRSDGDHIAVDERCIRVEHGVQTILNNISPHTPMARMSVTEEINSGRWKEITDASRRRFLAVDEERGLVFVWIFFDQVGTVSVVDVKGVGRREIPPERRRPVSGMMAEVFKVRAGRITHIEAFFDLFPFGMKCGWEESSGPAVALL